ncbi:tRNA (adenosine(37)-N6)-dimethylallyltransferase MiaA [Seohaeicola sp. SP36]|uniref:tRNA (adenosine(37)-N6)-dimethylallyltransferase MiaA n=1 Tax=unclassified Seohaeicola TaxID=2641111 RepID=UPI00237BC513|nr:MULTISPECIES: tRNA (adenosine(37)-N6)-dimethylallyltransferase MiaA [unclassified Seohaeicola]MDD9707242.1 tRNA (adenosine(37)-N6)-dimethylallyltransferase MiaA [Seohaeicola sp. 4SK31]MDD9735483.1 tRNA (adenosine(37)-N6)-dimethylallyltransferase MiaA [Seohaeicola sp. SP36]
MRMPDLTQLPSNRPVLIAGPTASGKSALALRIAEAQGGVIVNADAIQVFANWRVLTARPSAQDEARVPHLLYGHVAGDAPYSVGHWLREVAPVLRSGPRPIIVGGTGLYFTALTEGLAEIPTLPDHVRPEATARLRAGGIGALLADLDEATLARIDRQNPMRVQRAWEVWHGTGRGLAEWQDATPPPLLPLSDTVPILVDAPKDWLNARIAGRFAAMLAEGALEEARANLTSWNPDHLSSKAIGAPELIAHLQGRMTLAAAQEAATIATRQFAKRQRTWFRARMRDWPVYRPESA